MNRAARCKPLGDSPSHRARSGCPAHASEGLALPACGRMRRASGGAARPRRSSRALRNARHAQPKPRVYVREYIKRHLPNHLPRNKLGRRRPEYGAEEHSAVSQCDVRWNLLPNSPYEHEKAQSRAFWTSRWSRRLLREACRLCVLCCGDSTVSWSVLEAGRATFCAHV